jgi:hypothetical protein
MIQTKTVAMLLVTDAARTNPLRRVMPLELVEGKGHEYDKDRYREMLLEAAETVLGYFRFDRTLYGNAAHTKGKLRHHLN